VTRGRQPTFRPGNQHPSRHLFPRATHPSCHQSYRRSARPVHRHTSQRQLSPQPTQLMCRHTHLPVTSASRRRQPPPSRRKRAGTMLIAVGTTYRAVASATTTAAGSASPDQAATRRRRPRPKMDGHTGAATLARSHALQRASLERYSSTRSASARAAATRG
jgi:hypothetical protein